MARLGKIWRVRYMELKISNNAKKDKQTRTAMSQQALVNTLLSEKQPTAQPQQNVQPVQPAQSWGGK